MQIKPKLNSFKMGKNVSHFLVVMATGIYFIMAPKMFELQGFTQIICAILIG